YMEAAHRSGRDRAIAEILIRLRMLTPVLPDRDGSVSADREIAHKAADFVRVGRNVGPTATEVDARGRACHDVRHNRVNVFTVRCFANPRPSVAATGHICCCPNWSDGRYRALSERLQVHSRLQSRAVRARTWR